MARVDVSVSSDLTRNRRGSWRPTCSGSNRRPELYTRQLISMLSVSLARKLTLTYPLDGSRT